MSGNKIPQLTEEQLKSVYLITGESYFQKQFGQKIKDLLLKTDFDLSSYEKLDGKEYNLADVVQKAESLPFFSDRRLVMVSNAPYFSEQLSEKEKQIFSDYLDNPAPTTVLVFFADKVDKRQKLVKNLKKRGMLYEFSQLKPWEIDKWIREWVNMRGKDIQRNAVSLLVQRIGNELPLLEQELEKLDLYTAGIKKIEENHVRQVVPESLETNVFKLVDKIGEKQSGIALALVRKLTLNEPPVKILFLIARQFRLLIKIKAYLDDGLAVSEASKKLGIPPFIGKKVAAQSKNFSYQELQDAVKEVQRIDYAIKTGQLEGTFALERLIMSFVDKIEA
ncbi:DNA polymerase III subunit delta [Natranaerobius thermophilus]|uniref:DNA polymerase III subunit delta n=1 Tax=Natranaerobius thermophilus (strain ATCC BAA-1301 / DSM 18059 / JW/NM-WN-LF) TaxID=457570 RepID=B2A1L8_NATTJ|nr:DNA polymerase III subunit delta [Natranaerobius thermophilus]ACB84758.1 DNA polymerase III, delta subunit [Natranaerobius thermophilus JW/NM-WN-LF]